MRAYEGREAVLLELLETKALLKANENESDDNLPEYLRRNPALQNKGAEERDQDDPGDPGLKLSHDEPSTETPSSESDYPPTRVAKTQSSFNSDLYASSSNVRVSNSLLYFILIAFKYTFILTLYFLHTPQVGR